MREMKDSGIEWIGAIPSEWSLHPLYCYYGERKNKNRLGLENNLLSLSYGKVIRKDINTSEGLLPESFNTYNIVEAGDIIIRPTDLQNDKRSLRTGLVRERGIITSAYIDLCPIARVDSRYFNYLLHAYDVIKVFYNMGNGVRQGLNYSEFSKLMIFEPSLAEQKQIADYLDAKCAEIDSLTADIQTQIDTLEQYKRSVITEAVTKGLNPDAEMKDSGYDWLGFIPMSWKLQKGKYIFAQRSERGNTRELQLLSPTQNFGVIPQSLYEELSGMSAVKLNEHTDLQTMKTIHKGDYCISLRSFQGGFEYSGYEGVVSPAYQVFYPTAEISDGYYKYLFKDKGFIEKMNSYTMTLRDGKNIAFADFGNTYIPYPPINEQKAIANYLDVKVAKIDSIITSKQEQLAALAEYKKSLIFEYVTGKKEVPSASVVTTAIYPYFPAALNAKKPRFAQAVLMSKILDSGCTNMGRVKLEKMLYVIEYQLGFDFDTQYTRAAAGPLSPSIYECEGIISNRNKWFSINKARHSISYYPAKDMAKYRAYYKKYYAPYDAEICRIIGIFKNFTLDQAEVIATLFGAWNDFLINHKTFTDDDIVDEVWNNWNESKQRFPKDMWLRAIEKMKQLGITPKGYGKLTITKKEAPSA